jgi:choline dehydrogenase-like flavoprotein
MASIQNYDVIICGAGSGGGFLAGEISQYGSVLLLDHGPYFSEPPNPGMGTPIRRVFSTQINLGMYWGDGSTAPSPSVAFSAPPGENTNYGSTSPRANSQANSVAFTAYPMYMDISNPAVNTMQREPRLVGGGSQVNVGAWVRPRLVDWTGFVEATGVQGWTKAAFEPYFQKAEGIVNAHRDVRANWNIAAVMYEQAAKQMGIQVFEESSNRKGCIFCGHRLNAGMPCKYDALQGTLMTQIPKAVANGATVIGDAEVIQILMSGTKATGVIYSLNGQMIQANANKLVVLSAGAIGTPIIMRTNGMHLTNPNIGKYLRAHPGIPIDAILPGTNWNTDRGYQWNAYHYGMDPSGNLLDTIVHIPAGFPANTPWVASVVGTFGYPYKNLMRQYRQRAGAFIFALKPAITGRVTGDINNPVIYYPIADSTGNLEPKTLNDVLLTVRQVASVYKAMGAFTTYPTADQPDFILKQNLSQFVTSSGALHPQGTCRAGSDPATSVVDANCMSHDFQNLMCCDASVIPNSLSANPNATIMAIAARAADYVITQVLGKTIQTSSAAASPAHLNHDHDHAGAGSKVAG